MLQPLTCEFFFDLFDSKYFYLTMFGLWTVGNIIIVIISCSFKQNISNCSMHQCSIKNKYKHLSKDSAEERWDPGKICLKPFNSMFDLFLNVVILVLKVFTILYFFYFFELNQSNRLQTSRLTTGHQWVWFCNFVFLHSFPSLTLKTS